MRTTASEAASRLALNALACVLMALATYAPRLHICIYICARLPAAGSNAATNAAHAGRTAPRRILIRKKKRGASLFPHAEAGRLVDSCPERRGETRDLGNRSSPRPRRPGSRPGSLHRARAVTMPPHLDHLVQLPDLRRQHGAEARGGIGARGLQFAREPGGVQLDEFGYGRVAELGGWW